MSGICGIVRLDGGKPLPAEINGMTQVLQRRGPDGTRTWLAESAALGHTLLATTPEALVERLPLTHSESGCTITADVRLDNREELLAALDLVGESRVIGDGELILLAYLRWGEECPKYLLGDFAFAIWDPRTQALSCARDHMGMRQLIYHYEAGRHFIFATEPGAVLAHPEVPRRINDARIADFLDELEGLDLTSTFFEEVLRLPPAHCLTVRADGLTWCRYWELRPPPPLKLASDEEYARAFLGVFTEAVRCRLRSPNAVGSMLSGGIDSSAVTAIASRLVAADGLGPLPTLSATSFDSSRCPETHAIFQALEIEGIRPQLINDADIEKFGDELVRLAASGDEPFEGHLTLIRAIYLSARQSGLKIVLDGVAGDVVLTSSNRAAELLRRRRFRQAWQEARNEERYWKVRGHALRTIARAAWVAWIPEVVRGQVRKVRWTWNDRAFFRKTRVSRKLARLVHMNQRRRIARSHIPAGELPDAQRRTETIQHPHLTAARERYDRLASALAIESRDPFLDIRLIQFCLSLPEDQLHSNGWPKWILRRAMTNILPRTLIWRCGKEHLGWQFTQALFRWWPGWRARLKASRSSLEPYVAAPILKRIARDEIGEDLEEWAIELFFLSSWLDRNRPPTVEWTVSSGCEYIPLKESSFPPDSYGARHE